MLIVRDVPNAGRSYFAGEAIAAGSLVLSETPAVEAIYKVFRHECCAYCFRYDQGKNMKVILRDADAVPDAATLGRCCSDACAALYTVQSVALSPVLAQAKAIPSFKHEDMLRFCCSAMALSNINPARYCEMLALQDGGDLFDSDDHEALHQITERLTTTFPNHDASHSIAEIVHDAMSRSRVNCFGLWEQHQGRSFPESEQLGWALYPRSSFFNHACRPNIAKLRVGREMQFTALREIERDEELTISYLGDREFATSEERRLAIRDWGFDCACKLCQDETAGQHA